MQFRKFEEKLFAKKTWKKIVKGLSCVVVFCTVYALILPVVTQEAHAYCGQSEHTHDESCYKDILMCGLEEHEHTDSCYDEQGNLICGLEEHAHSADCYRQVLDCGMEEHAHTLECFSNPDADLEDADDWKVPDKEEGQTVQERIVQVAESQVGVKESTDNYLVENETTKKGISRYGQWDGQPYEDWSGAFARFVLNKADADDKTKDAKKDLSEWMTDLSREEELKPADKAEPGDVLFVYDDDDEPKAGIVTKAEEQAVTAIMGDWKEEVKKERFSKEDEKLHSVFRPVAEKGTEQEDNVTVPDNQQEQVPDKEEDKTTDNKNDQTNNEEVVWDYSKEVKAEDGATIRVSWNEGTFDTEDVTFQAKTVELSEEEMKKVQDQLDKDKDYQFRNYDLTFYVRDGDLQLQKVEPKLPVYVEIIQEEGAGESVVFHHNDLGEAKQVNPVTTKNVESESSAVISFESSEFSVFTVATLSEYTNAISIHNTIEGYQDLVNYANGNRTLNTGQYLKLEENVQVPGDWGTGTISVSSDFRLDLNGFVLTNHKTPTLFQISSGNVEIISSKTPSESAFTGSTANNGVNTNNKTISFNISSNNGITVSNVGILVANTEGDVVSITGGSLTMENVAVAGVSNWSAVYEKNSTVSLNNCYLVNGKHGLYADGGNVTIEDGYIANNVTADAYDQAGAAIYAKNQAKIQLGNSETETDSATRTNVQYNRFTNAANRSYGGAIHLEGSDLTVKNALIQNNEITGNDWACGGAIAALCSDRDNKDEEWTWGTPSTITIYEPAVIDSNTASAGGGGIFLQGPRVGGSAPTEFANASKLFMYGGTISNNTASRNEGGGIHQAASYRSYAYLFAGTITENHTKTTQHWGGGGIFVGEHSYMMLPKGASIYSNDAEGLGGGVAACSTGNIIFDKNVVMAQNTSKASAWTGESTQKPYDRTLAKGHEGFQHAGDARDFFSALYASISGELPEDLGGNNWSGSVDYNMVSGVNTGTLTANQIMGLVNNADESVQNAALQISPLKIYDNTSTVHGGGILVNGFMIGGDVEYLPSGPTLNFRADKRLLDKDGNPIDLGGNVFEFELLQNNEVIAEGKNDSFGLITFSPPVVYMPNMTGITPSNNYSWETSVTFVMREKQDAGSSFEMSQAAYTISLSYKTTLTYVLTYPVYNEQGAYVKDVMVFKADSVIVENSLKVTDADGNNVTVKLEDANPNLSDGHDYTFNNKILYINPENPDFINKQVPKKTITVEKKWQDENGNSITDVSGLTATFELVRKSPGESDDSYEKVEEITLSNENEWKHMWQDLDANYEYDVREVNVNPLYSVSKGITYGQKTEQIWIKANQIEDGKSYLIASKNTQGQFVILSGSANGNDSRFADKDKVVLQDQKGTTVQIDDQTYNETFTYAPSNALLYTAEYLDTDGYGLKNSSDQYTRAEEYGHDEDISGLMLTD